MQCKQTPIMGWASWNKYRVHISEQLLKEQMQALVDLGLRDLGYTYFNIDDGFQHGRGADSYVKADEAKFPEGMKAFADYAHRLGFRAGIYTDAGVTTCAQIWDGLSYNHNVGLYGYDRQDLVMYLQEWGYDFIKVDWCGGKALGLNQQERYTAISKLIREIEQDTGNRKIFNVCSWEFPGKWVAEFADSWRTGSDLSPHFESVLYQIDKVAKSPTRSLELTGPGHVNDLDMLQVGNGMSWEEDKSHFSMWALMSTPLMLGMDLTAISEETLEIIKNHELIAINQDSACLPPHIEKSIGNCEIWVKPLSDSNEKAVAFLNRGDEPFSFTVNWNELGFAGRLHIRDLWAHENIPAGEGYHLTLPAHGIAVFRVRSDHSKETVLSSGLEQNAPTSLECVEKDSVRALMEQGAVLVDVRTEQEYAAGHMDGAIHLPHNEIFNRHRTVFKDKATPIIVYCSTSKRSTQAGDILQYLGYENVYRLIF